jgi:hypothetical protein
MISGPKAVTIEEYIIHRYKRINTNDCQQHINIYLLMVITFSGSPLFFEIKHPSKSSAFIGQNGTMSIIYKHTDSPIFMLL